MVALKLSIAASELAVRMRERLRGNAVATAPSVVWQRPDGQRLLIELTTLKLRIIDGWLLCDLGVQTDQTGRTNLQVVFFLGRRQEADGLQAAVTINAATAAATQVAAVWGDDIQRVLWDVVLDALEASVWQTSERHPDQKITVQGFHCTPNMFEAEVLAEPVRIATPVPVTRLIDAEEGHE
jgi:hypothetical protein